jgi:hypothetical protein
VLGDDLYRQASVALEGRFEAAFFALFVVLVALAIPAAHLLGAFFSRFRRLRFLPAAIALAAMIADHCFLADDYVGVHGAVAARRRQQPALRARGRHVRAPLDVQDSVHVVRNAVEEGGCGGGGGARGWDSGAGSERGHRVRDAGHGRGHGHGRGRGHGPWCWV